MIQKNSNEDDYYLKKLNLIAKESEFLEIKEKETLFRIGDQGDKFYYILKGTVDIFKLNDVTMQLTLEEYFETLRELRENSEIYITKKIIHINKKIIDLTYEKFDYYIKVIFLKKLYSFLKNFEALEPIQQLFKEYKFIPYDFNLSLYDLEKFFSGKKSIDDYQNYFDDIVESGVFSLLRDSLENDEDTYLEKGIIGSDFFIEKKDFIIFEYEHFLVLGPGKYIGDTAIDANSTKITRNATIKASEKNDVNFAIFSKQLYKDTIYHKKIYMENLYSNFLFDNLFKYLIDKDTFFNRKYFSDFLFEEYSKGQFLAKENEKVDFIYIIFSGRLELSTKKNFFKMEKDLKEYLLLDERIKNFCDKNFNEKNFILTKDQIKKQNDKLIKHKDFIIKTISDREILGLENYIYNITYKFKARVCTEKLIIFKINSNRFHKIIKNEICEDRLYELSINKINSIVLRLNDLIKIFTNTERKIEENSENLKKIADSKRLSLRKIPTNFSLNEEKLDLDSYNKGKSCLKINELIVRNTFYNKNLTNDFKKNYLKGMTLNNYESNYDSIDTNDNLNNKNSTNQEYENLESKINNRSEYMNQKSYKPENQKRNKFNKSFKKLSEIVEDNMASPIKFFSQEKVQDNKTNDCKRRNIKLGSLKIKEKENLSNKNDKSSNYDIDYNQKVTFSQFNFYNNTTSRQNLNIKNNNKNSSIKFSNKLINKNTGDSLSKFEYPIETKNINNLYLSNNIKNTELPIVINNINYKLKGKQLSESLTKNTKASNSAKNNSIKVMNSTFLNLNNQIKNRGKGDMNNTKLDKFMSTQNIIFNKVVNNSSYNRSFPRVELHSKYLTNANISDEVDDQKILKNIFKPKETKIYSDKSTMLFKNKNDKFLANFKK